jgi:putative nucleotidyltransferase-like protein
MTAERERLRQSIAAALNGEAVDAGVDRHELLRVAFGHGLGPLLAATPFGRSLDGQDGADLAGEARLATLHAALLNDELRRILPAFAEAGIPAVLIKGAHLAHAVYPRPALRVRSDNDLLIPVEARAAAERVLVARGYRPIVHVRGSVILGQFQMTRFDRNDVELHADVHWRVGAPLMVEHLLPARQVIDARTPIPALGEGAWGPSLEHALALACLHMAAHHWPPPDLLWLYDLRQLAEALDPEGIRGFVQLARSGGFASLARAVLCEAGVLFPSPALRDLTEDLPADGAEPAMSLLRPGRGFLTDVLLDLRWAGWRERVQLLREHLLPDAAYVRATSTASTLPGAYLDRILGSYRRLRSHSGR